MKGSRWICSGLLTLSLWGCADLTVHRIPVPGKTDATSIRDANQPLVGNVTYYLPRTAITVMGTLVLTSCTVGESPKIEVTATLTPALSTEADPDYHFRISYEESRTWMKEINFSVANQLGYLQSFNGTINDQVGPDAAAAVGALVQIGGAVALGMVAAPAVAPLFDYKLGAPKPDHCAAVRKALAKVEDDGKILERIRHEAATTPDEIAARTVRLQTVQAEIDAQVKGHLTRSVSFKWLPTAADLDGASQVDSYYVLSRVLDLSDVITAWLTSGQQAGDASNGSPRSHLQVSDPFLLTLAVDAHTIGKKLGQDGALGQNLTLKDPGGLLIRDPALATLRICRQSSSDLNSNCTVPLSTPRTDQFVDLTPDVAPRVVVPLPQFGRIIVLPEHNGLFENDTLTASLAADGSISAYGYHSLSAAATGLTTLGTAGASAQTAIAARSTAIGNQNTASAAVTTAKTTDIQAPDTYNKALADCLTQQATITAAGGKPVPCQ